VRTREGKVLRESPSDSVRKRIAKEAALLLYTQQEKEYKQAKHRAARALAARTLPSNKDIAHEIDKLADETEGSARKERLVEMRRDALAVMVLLGEFSPRLVGSVWRGTANRNSDIDVEIFTSNQDEVLQRLKRNGLTPTKAEWQSVTKGIRSEKALHVFITLPSKNEVEIVARAPEKIDQTDKCETYGDPIKGLNIHQLRRLLLINPVQKFVPF
jgi:predicted nucleotidyltransferase